MRTRLAHICAALATLSCAEDSTAPRPEWMEPSSGNSAASIPVVIHGEGFLLRPVVDQSGGEAALEAGHRAWLGEVELVGVVWIDTRTLRATVPPGMEPGVKQLVVENAYGRRGGLDRAFEVTDSPAGALVATLGAAPATFNVGQRATLTLSVRNVGAAAVRDVVPEAIALTGTAAAGAVVDGPAPHSADRLAPGATATFTWSVTASTPGGLSLATTARAVDGPSSAPVSSPVAQASAEVQTPAALALALAVEADGTAVRVGRPLAIALTVSDSGEAGVLVTRVEPAVSPRDAATCGEPAPAPPRAIDGLGTRTFSWSCTPRDDKSFTLSVEVAGVDANSGDTLEAVDELRLRAR